MIKNVLFILLVLLSQCLWSVKPEQILSSSDVIAYHLDGQLFLMDINTGNEIKVKTATETKNLLWGNNGQSLFRIYYYNDDSIEPAQTKAEIYEIKLPTLEEVSLTSFSFDDPEPSDIKLAWGNDGTIVMMKVNLAIPGDIKSMIEIPCGYYDFSQNTYIPRKLGEDAKTTIYTDPLHSKVDFTGFTVKNVQLKDQVWKEHYELFAYDKSDAVDTSKVKIIQLTWFFNDTGFGIINLHPQPIEYRLSPDKKKILASYHYYYSDKKANYSQSLLLSLDPLDMQYETKTSDFYEPSTEKWIPSRYNALNVQRSIPVGETMNLDHDYWWEWTKDNRLVYCKEVGTEEKMKICVSTGMMLEKVLKTYKGFSSAHIFYRYKG